MKKLYYNAIFFILAYLILVGNVAAQGAICQTTMVESVTYELILDDGSKKEAVISASGGTPQIYRNVNSYYLNEDGTNKIKDIGKVTIKHNPDFMNQVALNPFLLQKNMTYVGVGACENENRSLNSIKKNSNEWSFNYNPPIDDVECVFGKGFLIELTDPLKTGDNLICSEAFLFETIDLNLENQCQLSMEPDKGATIEDKIVIKGTNIEDHGFGILPYLNGQEISSFKFLANKDYSTGLTGFISSLGRLSVDNYLFEVKYKRGEKQGENICVLRFPVVALGLTPTPAEQLDSTTSSQLQLEIEVTIPLCESIPLDADCRGKSCRAKCQDCEDRYGVWTGLGCMPTDFAGLINKLFTTFSGILGGLIFICILSNGIKIMTARGNPEAMKKGQEGLTACVVGFLVLALSVLFLKIVGVDILKIF